jgi:hypothetical protein
MNWLLQGVPFNGEYFNQEIFQQLATELQGESRPKHCLWTLLHIDNTKSHTSKLNLVIIEELYLKRTVHPPFSIDIASSNFSLWVTKRELASQPVAQIDELFRLWRQSKIFS